MPDDATRRYVVSAQQVRLGYALGGIGAVSLIVAILILATARPQGTPVQVDTTAHVASLARAQEALTGFELREDGSAGIDIDHAMQLVVERGVGLTITPQGTQPAAPADAGSDGAPMAQAAIDGGALFLQNCAACHQATGAGIPGAFPPLANHVGDLVAADRSYPAKLVLGGMVGPITVNGAAYNGLMPAFGATFSDAELAALLNHVVTAWGDDALLGDAFAPYAADEIAEWRALGLDSAAVHELRVSLDLP
ncbi:MAG: cytochrome c [Trueperaceae bacterium]|nr:cytochrome c [Trueperaceae bacterium]